MDRSPGGRVDSRLEEMEVWRASGVDGTKVKSSSTFFSFPLLLHFSTDSTNPSTYFNHMPHSTLSTLTQPYTFTHFHSSIHLVQPSTFNPLFHTSLPVMPADWGGLEQCSDSLWSAQPARAVPQVMGLGLSVRPCWAVVQKWLVTRMPTWEPRLTLPGEDQSGNIMLEDCVCVKLKGLEVEITVMRGRGT